MKQFHPNTIVRLAAGVAAAATILAAFNVITPDQRDTVKGSSQDLLELVVMGVTFAGTVWHPRHPQKPRKAPKP